MRVRTVLGRFGYFVDERFHEGGGAQRRKRLPFLVQRAIVIICNASNDHERFGSIALHRCDHLIDLRIEAEHVASLAQRGLQIIVGQQILAAGDHAEANARPLVVLLRRARMLDVDDLAVVHLHVQPIVGRR